MSNLVTFLDFERANDAAASSAETGVDESPRSPKLFENWNAIVASFEQMRDAPEVLTPTITRPDEH
jgi:hypothetical protein